MPELSPRRNIIVIADEAHRSQYDLILMGECNSCSVNWSRLTTRNFLDKDDEA